MRSEDPDKSAEKEDKTLQNFYNIKKEKDRRSNLNEVVDGKWSMQPSVHEVPTVNVHGAATSDGGSTDQTPIDAGNSSSSFEICGPLKVRLKRQRQGTVAAAYTAVAQDSLYTTVRTLSQQANIEPLSDNSNHIDASSSFSQDVPNNLEAPRGSRVNVSGIVWLESSGPDGLLVLHGVNWRGRRYAGALLPEDSSPSVRKVGRSATAHSRRGRRGRRRSRYQFDDNHEHRVEGDCSFLTYSQLQEQNDARTNDPLLVELSSDGSTVYRVTPKHPPAAHSAEQEIFEQYNATFRKSENIKSEEVDDVENKAKNAKAAQGAAVYSDISEDESTVVPMLNDSQPLPTASSSSEPAADCNQILLAAYARYLFERHEPGPPGMQKQH